MIMSMPPQFQSPRERELLRKLKTVIDTSVTQLCRDHYSSPTQEPPLTGALGQLLESELKYNRLEVDGLEATVAHQVVPSLGLPTERIVGADLYISIDREDKHWKESKGILAQSKWDHSLNSDPKLSGQAASMFRRTKKAAFVLVYGPDQIHAVPAKLAINNHIPEWVVKKASTLGDVIISAMKCHDGDFAIGRNLRIDRPESMVDVMKRLSAPHGIEITIEEN